MSKTTNRNKKLREFKEKLNALAIASNEHRFDILLALLTSSVIPGLGKHSHTFTELKEITGLSNPDLSYHLKSLRNVKLVFKKPYLEEKGITTYYHITNGGKCLLKALEITPKRIREINKRYKN